MQRKPLLGTHVSVAGGLHTAFERATRVGCATMQIFVKNANTWNQRSLTDADIASYKTAAAGANVSPVIAHAAYLINLCAIAPETLKKSIAGYEDELRRCEAIGVMGLVVHPGAHMGKGEEAGVKAIAESLNIIHAQTPGFTTFSLLEVTAGQGTTIGYKLEHLRDIIAGLDEPQRAGICLDTCHAFAAGYDLRNDEGWASLMHDIASTVGLDKLKAIHVNDSEKGLGSKRDRHEHIGKGEIGLEGFRFLMNDPRLAAVPKILETDKSEDLHEDIENMEALRSLIRSTPA
ncbi:MAG: deoxyribonuclease IV [Ignavibacteriae bacterium]|nr:deoxyribonuclease IV [Ignavibacteriota bacterium]